MRDTEGIIGTLTDQECWAELRRAPLGRLALTVGTDIDVFPVTFRVDGQSLFFRTSPGLKLAEIGINPRVTLEIDGFDDRTAWSVVAKGVARRLRLRAELDVAQELRLTTWLPTPTPDIVRIDVQSIQGRSFERAVQLVMAADSALTSTPGASGSSPSPTRAPTAGSTFVQ